MQETRVQSLEDPLEKRMEPTAVFLPGNPTDRGFWQGIHKESDTTEHIRACARAHTHTHTCAHTCAHAHTHTRTHTRVHMHACTRTHTRVRAWAHTRTHTYTHARTHAHTHMRTHTHAHTHTHTHTHTRTVHSQPQLHHSLCVCLWESDFTSLYLNLSLCKIS